MTLKIKTETITQLEKNNTIYELQYEYTPKSVKVLYVGNTIPFTEIGSKYIQLTNEIPVGDSIEVTYKYIGEDDITDETVFKDNGVLNRIRKLEEQSIQQQVVIEKLLVAVNERVNKQSFNLWLTAVQKNLGRDILPSQIDSIQNFHSVN